EVARAGDEAGDVAPRGERIHIFAERRMRADLEGARLDLLGEHLFLRLFGRARELVAQLLELIVRRPAEPGLLAERADRRIGDRVPDVRRDPGGAEHVPAALGGRVLLRAA